MMLPLVLGDPGPVLRLLDRAALVAALASPVFLMHGRGFAEVLFAAIDLAFLLRCALARDWGWLGRGWVPVGLAWWGWLVVCSLPVPALHLGEGGLHSLGQALLMVRFLVLVAALEHQVLRDPAARRWMLGVLSACAAYIALQSLLQFATGRDLYGWPRNGDGELTGPFREPRAGPPLSRLIFPAVLPPAARLLDRRGRGASLAAPLAAAALVAASVAVMVLIGQRMPLILTLFGMAISGLLLPRLRRTVLAALVLGAALVAATPVISPPTAHRLIAKFSRQMEDLPQSPYGLIAARAVVIAAENPWTGRGYDGFRTGCPLPSSFHGWTWLTDRSSTDAGGGAAMCNIHPHNHYLQAVTDSGFPGLVLFCALILAWLRPLFRGLWAAPDPLRVGLFVAALIQEWPIASASSFTAIEIGGFFFVMLGFGLAEARHGVAARIAQPARAASVRTCATSPSHGTPSR